jgi:hypothetical protein
MADTAAHLVDHVFPEVPVRQWVLSLPFALRYRMGYDARLTLLNTPCGRKAVDRADGPTSDRQQSYHIVVFPHLETMALWFGRKNSIGISHSFNEGRLHPSVKMYVLDTFRT